jgi:hypothetical protein
LLCALMVGSIFWKIGTRRSVVECVLWLRILTYS